MAISLTIVVLLGFIVAIVFLFKSNDEVIENRNVSQVTTTNQNSNIKQENNEVINNTKQDSDVANRYMSSGVDWNGEPKEVSDIGLFDLLNTFYPYRAYYSSDDGSKSFYFETKYSKDVKYYNVGKVVDGRYKGSDVYLAIVNNASEAVVVKGLITKDDYTYDGKISVVFLKTPDKKFVITNDFDSSNLVFGSSLSANSNDQMVSEFNKKSGGKVIFDAELYLEQATHLFDKYIDNASGVVFVVNNDHSNDIIMPSGSVLMKDFGNGYRLYSMQSVENGRTLFKFMTNPILILRYPVGLYAAIEPGLQHFVYLNGVDKDKVISPDNLRSDVEFINWTSDEKPLTMDESFKKDWASYSMEDPLATTDVIDYVADNNRCSQFELTDSWNTDVFDLSDLVILGKTDLGDEFYEVRNKNILFTFWQMKGTVISPNYKDFIKYKPMIIRKDPFGVYTVLFRSDFVKSLCWGEPVIYLYPEKKTNISVKLNSDIGLTATYPKYNGEWNVLAYPDGSIYTKKDDRKYPYLFWEGSLPLPKRPVAQAFLSKDDVHSYFEAILPKLGLNDSEKNDFEGYWEKKLSNNPYYLVRFYSTESIDKIAPLNVSPTPDTEIRLLLTYEKYNKDIGSRVPYITVSNPVPKRNGFTLVEWGGVVHNEDF